MEPPASPEPRALARLKAGDAAGAEAELVTALAATPAGPVRARIWEAISEARLAQGYAFEAAQALELAGAAQLPRLALRRTRLLIQSGRFPAALAALDSLPPSARQGFEFWSLKADALRQSGRWKDAAEAAAQALKANPSSRNMALIRAAGLGHGGRWTEAEAIFKRFADFAPAIEMHAGALVGSGRTADARQLLSSALARFPADAGLYRALAMIAWMEGQTETFAAPLIAASDANPADLSLGLAAADLLRRAGRHEEALLRLERLGPATSSPVLASAAALLLSALGRHPEAADLARLSSAQAPRLEWVRRNAACVLLSAGAVKDARLHSDWGRALDPMDQEWIAIDAVARRAANDMSYLQTYDYDRFVQTFELPPPEGFQSTEDFLAALADRLRALHGFTNHPLDQSLRGGSQLQLNPDVPQDPLIGKLFAALSAPINQYIASLGRDPEHPFLARNSGRWRMQGCWSVRLVKGGSHVNHIHPEGWISSAFYVVVPQTIRPESNSREGWITFGAPFFPVCGITPERSICPRPGRLVLFPSFMWHGVNAFSEDAERISVAFDLIPD